MKRIGTLGSILLVVGGVACGQARDEAAFGVDAHPGGGGDDSGGSGEGTSDSFLIYAHSDDVLYTIDLSTKSLVEIGSFGVTDAVTDLAVAPDGTIYVISYSELFTASPTDGHATSVGSLASCGQKGVALTTTADGRLWVGDYMGVICQIDISGGTPIVQAPVMMQDGLALSGDMVGVGDGTVFGSAYRLGETATQADNLLVEVDVATGAVTQVGATGFPRLYGVAFQQNKVFGFTHDGSGRVITIDTTTGEGAMFETFVDPASSAGIRFAGAGVNSRVVLL